MQNPATCGMILKVLLARSLPQTSIIEQAANGGTGVIYNKAHELAKALKTSEEYRAFSQAKVAVAADAEAKKMVKAFLQKKTELDYAHLAGKEDKAKMEQLQQMFAVLSYNKTAKGFVETYVRLQQIMADVSKILGDVVAEGMDRFAEDE
jgi:cell fate (sporulation/competence/biofilm development) regulator YlbF (YheA/YmcA/DUF963 family)